MFSSARFWWGICLIALGVVFLLDRANVLDVSDAFRTLWPLLLVALGVRIVLRGRTSKFGTPAMDASAQDPGTPAGAKASAGETVGEWNVFGEAAARVTSSAFRGGKVSTVFGQADVDLRGATLAPGTHMLKIDCTFGGIVVRVPQGMAVTVAADSVLGSVLVNGEKKDGFFPALEWTSGSYASNSDRLQIDASTILGEVKVLSVV